MNKFATCETTCRESRRFAFRLWNPRIRRRDTAFPHDGTVPPWCWESSARPGNGRVHAVTPEPQHREREDSPSASGASQFGCRFRGRHGFLTAAFVRRPARLVRPLDPPVWVGQFSLLVLPFVLESYDASCIRSGWNRKLSVYGLQRKRARTFEKVAKCLLSVCFVLIILCRVGLCIWHFRCKRIINSSDCAPLKAVFLQIVGLPYFRVRHLLLFWKCRSEICVCIF